MPREGNCCDILHAAVITMQWNSHRWASTKLNSTTREGGEQECTFESAAARSSRNGVGEFPQSNFHRSLHPLPSSPSSNGRPIVMVPSFISSSHRERWTAPLKSDLHIGSGSIDSGGRGRRRRNYWRSLRRRLPDNKGTEAKRKSRVEVKMPLLHTTL